MLTVPPKQCDTRMKQVAFKDLTQSLLSTAHVVDSKWNNFIGLYNV
jgi:hypothetical protein